MTDGDALLRAILCDPADDTARLVYADWLQGNGEGDRAEFIRVQCELARRERPVSVTGGTHIYDHGDDYDNLRRRERELWGGAGLTCPYEMPTPDFGYHLGHEAPPFSQSPVAVVRRGFVDEVRLTNAAFLGRPCPGCIEPGELDDGDPRCRLCKGAGRTPGLAKAIFSAHPVTRVVLTDRGPVRLRPMVWGWPDNHGFYHGSSEDAVVAVSLLLVAHGRHEARLPPLPAPTHASR